MVIKINIVWCVSTNDCFISAAELTNRDIFYEKVLNLNFSDWILEFVDSKNLAT